MTKTLLWSSEPPTRMGLWFHRYSPAHELSVVKVLRVKDETELSYQYGNLDADPEDEMASIDWVCNARGSQWCGPIPQPHDD